MVCAETKKSALDDTRYPIYEVFGVSREYPMTLQSFGRHGGQATSLIPNSRKVTHRPEKRVYLFDCLLKRVE
jgi:hypothetical protein